MVNPNDPTRRQTFRVTDLDTCPFTIAYICDRLFMDQLLLPIHLLGRLRYVTLASTGTAECSEGCLHG